MLVQIFHLFLVAILGLNIACGTVNSNEIASIEDVNSAVESIPADPNGEQTAVFAGGCFWGVEAVFEHIKGVRDVRSGYAGGAKKDANYDDVSAGITKHAEAVEIKFDPALVTYEQLLKVFFTVVHDPTQLDQQGPDTGPQYRSAIFFTNGEQQRSSNGFIAELTSSKAYAKKIVTQIVPLTVFYAAEDYHQDFMKKNPDHPYIVAHDIPKVEALKKQFPDIYR